jgi:hypothetical protein
LYSPEEFLSCDLGHYETAEEMTLLLQLFRQPPKQLFVVNMAQISSATLQSMTIARHIRGLFPPSITIYNAGFAYLTMKLGRLSRLSMVSSGECWSIDTGIVSKPRMKLRRWAALLGDGIGRKIIISFVDSAGGHD